MSEAQQATAYTKWLMDEVAASIEDSRASIQHDDVMIEMESALEKNSGRESTSQAKM